MIAFMSGGLRAILEERRVYAETIMEIPDYYEFLQISPNAEPDTIHRIYRFLAVRLHPDNPKTGDHEKFFLLKQAYDVLSNPARRAEYDTACKKEVPQPVPLSTAIDFMDSMKGELNRRLAVLALLYIQRRTNPYTPEVSLFEVERRMGFPRDYLDFTTWYLQKKGYITRADNSDFELTAEGVDFVESQRVNIPVLNKLLTGGTGPSTPDEVTGSMALISPPMTVNAPSPTPIIVPAADDASVGSGANGDDEMMSCD
jgi:curved DNA-binding protein